MFKPQSFIPLLCIGLVHCSGGSDSSEAPSNVDGGADIDGSAGSDAGEDIDAGDISEAGGPQFLSPLAATCCRLKTMKVYYFRRS